MDYLIIQKHFIPVLATGLGVKVIEKHLTLDRKDESIDGAFSLLPEDFKQMCTNVKKPTTVWASEGAEKLKRLKMLNSRGLFWCQKRSNQVSLEQ